MAIFIFANTEKARKSTEQGFSLEGNRPTIRIGITIGIIVGRTFRTVTIVQLIFPEQIPGDDKTALRPDSRIRKSLGKRLKLHF